MTKASIQQFSTTAASNTDIDGINVNTGWSPANVGPAFREFMALTASSLVPLALSIAGDTALTLTAAQASAQVIQFTGALTGACTVTLPNALFFGWAQNATTGGFNVILTAGAGTTVTLPPNGQLYFYTADGATNVAPAGFSLGIPASLTVTGAVTAGSLAVVGAGSVGSVTVAATDSSHPGVVEFFNNTGTRVGYVGYSDGGTNLVLESENGYTGWSVTGNFNVAGTMIVATVDVTTVNATTVSSTTVDAGTLNVSGSAGVTGTVNATTVAASGAVTAGGNLGAGGNLFVDGSSFLLGTNADPAGNGVPGVTITGSGASLFLSAYSSSGAGTLRVANANSPSGQLIEFFNGIGANVGSISTNGATTTYGTTSDQRLKIDDGLIDGEAAAKIVRALRPRWFRWQSHSDRQSEPGFFAQQVHRVFPWAVTKGRGKVGSKSYHPWSMDAGKLMPVLVAYVQHLERRLVALERR